MVNVIRFLPALFASAVLLSFTPAVQAAGDESYPLFVYNATLLAQYPYLGNGLPPAYPPTYGSPNVTAWKANTSAEWNATWTPPTYFTPIGIDILDWFNYSAYQYAQQWQIYSNNVQATNERIPATQKTLPHYGNPLNPTWDGLVYGYNAFQSPGMIGAFWNVHRMTRNLPAVQSFGNNFQSSWNGTNSTGYNFASWATTMLQETSGNPASCFNLTNSHDVGFCTLLPNLLGYRVSGNVSLLDPVKTAAFRLAGRFLAEAGVTQSWTGAAYVDRSWTIVDNMMNIELLYWASQYYQNQTWMDMAFSHANRTMYEAFRPDNSTYHVVEYNFTTGIAQKKHTRQGYSDNSTWSRGQAWTVYGFTHSFRYTGYQPFLDKAIGAANLMLNRIAQQGTADSIPYWDFDAPLVLSTASTPLSKCTPIVNTTTGWRDTSAASVLASALLELVTFLDDSPSIQTYYWQQASYILRNLTTWQFSTRGHTDYPLPTVIAFGTSNWPTCLVNHSLSYGEHFFQEAMYRAYVLDQNRAAAVAKQAQSSSTAAPSLSSSSSYTAPTASSSSGGTAPINVVPVASLPPDSAKVTFEVDITSAPTTAFIQNLATDVCVNLAGGFPASAGVTAASVAPYVAWGGASNVTVTARRLLALEAVSYYVMGNITALGGGAVSAYQLAQNFASAVQSGTFATTYSGASVPRNQTVQVANATSSGSTNGVTQARTTDLITLILATVVALLAAAFAL